MTVRVFTFGLFLLCTYSQVIVVLLWGSLSLLNTNSIMKSGYYMFTFSLFLLCMYSTVAVSLVLSPYSSLRECISLLNANSTVRVVTMCVPSASFYSVRILQLLHPNIVHTLRWGSKSSPGVWFSCQDQSGWILRWTTMI
jgi:hypothetical protein